MDFQLRLALLGAALVGATPQTASAQESPTPLPAASEVFQLGEIYLGGVHDAQPGTSSYVSAGTATQEGRLTLDDALKTVPGVAVGNSGGSRNERLVFVRGFDRFQVPLSVDGIRIYLPADNRLDFGRFLTPDLAEVQVQKGYVSVLNGPGAMGGAVNLATRKPVSPFEGELQLGLEAGNRGDLNGRHGFLSLGTLQEKFYAQGSFSIRDFDGFDLSRGFEPTAQQGAGQRGNSESEDSRLNLKFGFTPNATDEYVVSYTRQDGSKSAPYNTLQPIRLPGGAMTPGAPGYGGGAQRDWTWPKWDLQSLAFYSKTALGEGADVKTKLYYNTFDNVLSAWDDSSHSTQTANRAFDSIYDDSAWGAAVDLGGEIGGGHELRGAVQFRSDRHESTNHSRPDVNAVLDPTERSREDTWSFGVEDTWRLNDQLRLVGGLSYERADVKMADRTPTSFGEPVGSADAWNWQAAAVWEPEAGGAWHASVSSRTRFPSLFERYSTRFGYAVPNPDLASERAVNFEVGYKGDLGPAFVEAAAFYSQIDDMIQSIPRVDLPLDDRGRRPSQNQNVGDGRSFGFEVGASLPITDRLDLGAAYTYLDREISDPVRPGLQPTDTPRHTAYLRLDWRPLETLTLSPSLELASSRRTEAIIQTGDFDQVAYARMGGFALVNLDAKWEVRPNANVVFGVRNLFDKDYALTEGFPEAGRSFYVTTQLKF
ncbi:TonB-dependent receptor [Neomegalonema sp.]|uniref:TonB-dependent receptor plug domain-containing protein n=1 Tax=Neomegalonema sp. TaxID=2039713 RepID=UPI002609A68E|nr:TonB-dependent receptor [Neomegalonema sp.]MDD2867825.1 TonB-dependent receptor [Neomegalonema sp.]